ncbi:MAG TPA: FAD-binding oxidoreductase [Candidatus Thermoplasmatota archaeon]|nr:FAD-binding oxidoreductase [Candidatus Thermoplasmatota archaeon]
MTSSTVVVGAGVLGVSAAWHLAEAGERVLLVDREGPAAGTSRHGAGIVSHLAWHPLNVALILESARVFRELTKEAAGEEAFRFIECGSATLVSAKQEERLRELAALQRAAGARVDLVPPERIPDVAGLQEIRTDDLALAACCPDDGWGSPPRYAAAALSRFLAAGGEYRQARVDGLRVEGGRVTGVLLDGAFERADRVLVAGGVWAAGVLAASGLPLPVRAYRTQATIARVDLAAPPAILHDGIQGFYLRPDAPGQILAGNGTTTKAENPDAVKTEADTAFMVLTRQRLLHRFPRLAALEAVRAWAFVDAATPDRHPLVGADPRVEGLHLLVGGNGFGFMRSPALGAAVASLVLGEKPPVDLLAFRPGRFEGRWADDFAIAEGFTL